MKKVLLVIGLAFAVMTASAQLYVGGALGFALDGADKDKDGKKNGISNSIFGILPEVGYSLNEKIDVGITLGLVLNNGTSWENDKKQFSTKSTGFGAEPYIRYSFVEFGKFALLGKAAFGFGVSSSNLFDQDDKKVDHTQSGETNISFAVSPVVVYNLSDNICLFTNLNFAGLDFTSTIYKADGEKTGSKSDFGIGIDTNNAFTTGAVEVGFVFKF